MGILSDIGDFIGIFVESLTAIEKMWGIYNINILGLTIEHPLAFILLLPLFFTAFYVGLRYPKFGLFFSSVVIAVVSVSFIVMVGIGVSTTTIVNLIFFLITIPLAFASGCVVGWLIHYILSRVCSDREGGILCKVVR